MSTNSCGESVTTGAGADVGTDAEAAAEDALSRGHWREWRRDGATRSRRTPSGCGQRRIPGSGGARSVVNSGAWGEKQRPPHARGRREDEEHLRGGKDRGSPGR